MPADAIHDVQHNNDGDAGPALQDAPKAPPPHERTGPLPHEHAAPTPLGHATPLPPYDEGKSGSGKLVVTGLAGLLVGVGAGFAVGRATAPRRRGLHLPFGGARRRAAFGAAKLAPVVAYKTGRTAGKGTLAVGRGARKATKAARGARNQRRSG